MSCDENENLISICIPTRNRPDYLCEAIQSCFLQDYRPLEILIGDDSDQHNKRFSIQELETPSFITLRIFKNIPPLGQAKNINRLLNAAIGSRLVLLHDDDWLLPKALDAMAAAWDTTDGIAAVFGRQLVTKPNREVLPEETKRLNKQYNRTAQYAGLQQNPIISSLEGQFPNDGYLIDSALAKRVQFRSFVGQYTDHDFGVRYGFISRYRKYYLLDKSTAAYRLSPDSVSRSRQSPDQAHRMWEALLSLQPPADAAKSYEQALGRLALGALLSYAQEGKRMSAWRVFFSHRYGRRRLSLRGAYHVLAILLPGVIPLREAVRFTQHSTD